MAYKDKHDPRLLEARRRHYYANKQSYKDRKLAYKKRIQGIIREAKNVPCTDCDVRYPFYIMQFDHTNDNKEYNIAALVSCGNISKVLAEIAKCEVVCANCHAERTYSRLSL